MDYQKPDPDQGSTQYDARVEDDFVRPLQPMKSISHRRLPAALPLAIAGILVVSSIAFGATVIRNVVTPPPDASGVDVGDETTVPESEAPVITEAPVVTEAPATEAPAPQPLTLTASASAGKVTLTWTKYAGDDFAYYKVVRSTDATVSWPLGEGDTLVAAICDIDKLSLVDTVTGGKTYSYEVFAVKSAEDGYAVIVGSNVVTIAVPAPTPAPTRNCNMSLTASLVTASAGGVQPATAGGGNVHLSWSKYRCDHFQYYGVVFNTSGNPVLHIGETPPFYYTEVTTTSVNVYVEPGHTYYFRVYAYNDQTYCEAKHILGWSNVAKVVVPAV